MAYCGTCGNPVADGEAFCTSCGAPMKAQGAPTPMQVPQNPAQAPDPQTDIQDNKVMGILAYLGILVLIPIFAAKESPFAKYHANQGLVLAIAEVGWWVITSIISAIVTAALFNSWAYSGAWGVWGAISTLLGLVNILFLVLAIMGITNAVGGKCKPLPIIGKIQILK